MRRFSRLALVFLALLWLRPLGVCGIERFPPPDFESGYSLPSPTTPAARASSREYLDTALLLLALLLASHLALRKRSRRALLALSISSLIYFGFHREGCICAIGSVQNVALALFDKGYAMPLGVLAFFALPLVFALFFGRTFCAAVCPHGALQDLVLVRPVKVPPWLERALRTIPYVYLAMALLLAATGSAFVICRYDPFVGIFRLGGSRTTMALGVGFLLLALFVGRPYCRFMCPYGALLSILARASKWRVTITPDHCNQCRLCEDSCPFGAIRQPTATTPGEGRPAGRRRLAWMLLALPLLVLASGWLGARLSAPLSALDARAALADRVWLEDRGQVEGTIDASDAFRQTGDSKHELYLEALALRQRFAKGGWLMGILVGLVLALKLLQFAVKRTRVDYEADRGQCLACGRCFEYCPYEQVRRGTYIGPPVETLAGGASKEEAE